MFLFESFDRYSNLEKRISNGGHYFIVVDTTEDAIKLMNFLETTLKFICSEEVNKEKVIMGNYVPLDERLAIEVQDKKYGFRTFSEHLILNDTYKEYFYFYPKDIEIIRKAYNILPDYNPKKFIYEAHNSIEEAKELCIRINNKEEYDILVDRLRNADELYDIYGYNTYYENIVNTFSDNKSPYFYFFSVDLNDLGEDIISWYNLDDRREVELLINNNLQELAYTDYVYEKILTIDDIDTLIKSLINRKITIINRKPTYAKRKMVYESSKIDIMKKIKENQQGLFIIPENKESSIDLVKLLERASIPRMERTGVDDELYLNHDYENTDDGILLFFIIYNKTTGAGYSFIRVSKEISHTLDEKDMKEHTIHYPKDKSDLMKFFEVIPMYNKKQFVYESMEIDMRVYCDNRVSCVKFEDILHKNGWTYMAGSRYLVKNGSYYELTFYRFDIKNKIFTAMQGESTGDYKLKYPDDIGRIRSILKITPSYQPKKFIYESKKERGKVLYAFDMDDTLVYSNKFADIIKPILKEEFLNPENIFFNKLDNIGIGIDEIRYENGRLYFDDPDKEYNVDKDPDWVRKKDRVYLTQPDAYFLTEDSMPIGTYDEIVDVYNDAPYRCIITARKERLRNQTIKVLKKLGIKKPNVGLFMYRDNSFARTHEYKSNKLLELQRTHGFSEVHYFDDNIKLLKKIRQDLQGKNINIYLYKVTKNRYRKI